MQRRRAATDDRRHIARREFRAPRAESAALTVLCGSFVLRGLTRPSSELPDAAIGALSAAQFVASVIGGALILVFVATTVREQRREPSVPPDRDEATGDHQLRPEARLHLLNLAGTFTFLIAAGLNLSAVAGVLSETPQTLAMIAGAAATGIVVNAASFSAHTAAVKSAAQQCDRN